ncbi:hypothetical protein EV421DRAFT_1743927 [Armillaria borealis]|uniref:Uncharacterized protein n=1 Tax=Armillaria borealis TaxID=47425 RepID=A0AA39IX78_9AGAR|nr:hypothetical protein EV421DRAFT_1743927 [Armillaria borealis]
MGYAPDQLKVLSLVNTFFRDTADLHQFKSITANLLCDLGACIWLDLPLAFPYLNSLNIVDYVAPWHRRNFLHWGQQHVGGHHMQGIRMESNDEDLVKNCLEALVNMDWYRRVVILEIRSSSNVIEIVGSPSIHLPGTLLVLVELMINCADDDLQPMQTILNIKQCLALTHLKRVSPVYQWINVAHHLCSDKFPVFKELQVLLYPSPMLSPYGDLRLMQRLLRDIFSSDQNNFSIFHPKPNACKAPSHRYSLHEIESAHPNNGSAKKSGKPFMSSETEQLSKESMICSNVTERGKVSSERTRKSVCLVSPVSETKRSRSRLLKSIRLCGIGPIDSGLEDMNTQLRQIRDTPYTEKRQRPHCWFTIQCGHVVICKADNSEHGFAYDH